MKYDFTHNNESKNMINKLIKKASLNEKYKNTLKYTEDKDYHIIILNLNLLLKEQLFTITDIIHIILNIEKTGYICRSQIMHYIYFVKKKSILNRLFKK